MKGFMMKIQAKKSGFTLIELLVVISIIALLIAILLPALRGARRAAMAVKCATNQKQFAIAVSGYLVDNKDYFMSGDPTGYNDGNYALDHLADYCNAKSPTGKATFNKGWDYNYEATSPVILCPESGTKIYSKNYGWSIECLTAPNGGSVHGWGYYGKYARSTDLPADRSLILMADASGSKVGVHEHWDTPPGIGSVNSLRYRHGGGNDYGHGGSRFNAMWSDGSVRPYAESTLGKSKLFL